MANLENKTKTKLEHLLEMGGGYVLDFSNATFADFIQTSVGVDIDSSEYTGSKAARLRQLWQKESNEVVVKLSLEMFEHAEMTRQMRNVKQSDGDRKLQAACIQEFRELTSASTASPADLEFLEKDYGKLNISEVPVPVTFRDVTQQRIYEIERCLKADAPLAVIFLSGSTLEGLLYAVAEKNIPQFNQCKSAPKHEGKVKPLAAWTLNDFITTSHELHIIGTDVVKHAHAVKDFRNYIHPRQQIKDNFTPRLMTAKIAYQVLQAAIADLKR